MIDPVIWRGSSFLGSAGGYEKMAEVGAAQKAVIVTESRRTQDYLRDFLETNGYAGTVVTFSGTNRDERSKQIYEQWLQDNRHSGHVTGSRAIDLRHAIIDDFREEALILIATEGAVEGINLQFCSLLINFYLPWNPQRIGRVHRYPLGFRTCPDQNLSYIELSYSP